MRWPLGVVSVVYGSRPIQEAARTACEQRFEHIDAREDTPDDLALPVADRFSMRPLL